VLLTRQTVNTSGWNGRNSGLVRARVACLEVNLAVGPNGLWGPGAECSCVFRRGTHAACVLFRAVRRFTQVTFRVRSMTVGLEVLTAASGLHSAAPLKRR
jgi:hypothetical protein